MIDLTNMLHSMTVRWTFKKKNHGKQHQHYLQKHTSLSRLKSVLSHLTPKNSWAFLSPKKSMLGKCCWLSVSWFRVLFHPNVFNAREKPLNNYLLYFWWICYFPRFFHKWLFSFPQFLVLRITLFFQQTLGSHRFRISLGTWGSQDAGRHFVGKRSVWGDILWHKICEQP